MSNSNRSTSSRRRNRWGIIVAAGGFWLILILAWQPLNLFFQDAFARFWTRAQPEASDIIIVKLTDASLANRMRVPLPRDVLTKVVEEVAKAGPRTIILNHVIERDRTMRDTQLYAALTNHGNAYLAQELRHGPGDAVLAERLIDPFSRLTNRLGAAYFESDPDGIVRAARLKFSDGSGRQDPALPALAANLSEDALANLPSTLPLRFRGPPDALFPSVNAETLIQWSNAAPVSALAALVTSNSTVIIGPFYDTGANRHYAPAAVAGPEGTVTDTHLLAYAIDTLTQQPRPHRMPLGAESMLSIIFLIAGFAFSERRTVWIGAGAAAAYFVASVIVARWGWVWPVVLTTLGWLLGFFLGRLFGPGARDESQQRPDRRKDQQRRAART